MLTTVHLGGSKRVHLSVYFGFLLIYLIWFLKFYLKLKCNLYRVRHTQLNEILLACTPV